MNRPSSLQARPRLSSPASLRRHMCQAAWRIIIYVGLYSVSLVNRKVTPRIVLGNMLRKPLALLMKSCGPPLGRPLPYLPFVERTLRISDGFARKDSHCIGRRLCVGRDYKNFPHFASTSRASSADSAEVGGNLSRHANGRQASMIALEWEVTPRSLSSGAMRGSSAELQALRTMSMPSAGSQRVATAHITSARFDGSMSSSTTTTMRAM